MFENLPLLTGNSNFLRRVRLLRGKRDFNLGIATGSSRIYGCNDAVDILMNCWPSRIAKDEDGDPAALQVLLVADIFVGREQEIEPGFF